MDELQAAGVPVHTVGKIGQVFDGVGVDVQHKGATNAAALAATAELIDALDGGFVFTNLVETDQVYGHRGDVAGLPRARCGRSTPRSAAGSSGWTRRATCSSSPPTTAATRRRPGTDHTREHAPLLARFDGHGGRRHDGPFADVGASVLRWLTGRDAAASRDAVSLTHKFCVGRRVSDARCAGIHSLWLHWSPVPRWTVLIAAAALIAACGDSASSAPAPATKKVAESKPKPTPNDAAERHRAAGRAAVDRAPGRSSSATPQDFAGHRDGCAGRQGQRAIAAAKALPIGTRGADRRRHRGRGRPRDVARRHGLHVRRHRHDLRQDLADDGAQDARGLADLQTTARRRARSRRGSSPATRRAAASTSSRSRRRA